MASPSDVRAKAEAYRDGLAMLSRSQRRLKPPASLAEDFNHLLGLAKTLLPNASQLVLPPRVQTTWDKGVEQSVADYASLHIYSLTLANLLAKHFPDAPVIPLPAAASANLSEECDCFFPWIQVDACRFNEALQEAHELERDCFVYMHKRGLECPRCCGKEDDLTWFYFRTPSEMWAESQGYGGWMVVCDTCHLQVEFFCDDFS